MSHPSLLGNKPSTEGPAQSEPGQNEYIPGLDGLRAIAIGMVIIYHLKFESHLGFKGAWWIVHLNNLADAGYIGVNLFFVLSGFLITGILLKEKTKTHHLGRYLWRFEVRRVLRIIPLYALLVAIRMAMFNGQEGVPKIAQLLFIQNWWDGLHYRDRSYTGVTWSLAIEEQYYLIWPVMVWLLSRDKLKRLSIALIFTAFILRPIILQIWDQEAVYYWSVTRMDELATGALIAIWISEGSKWPLMVLRASFFPLAGALLIAFSAGYGLWEYGPFIIIGYPLITLTGASALTFVYTKPDSLIVRVLEHPALTTLGKASYGVYLLHPVAIVITLWLDGHCQLQLFSSFQGCGEYLGMVLGITTLLTGISYPIEQRILSLKNRLGP